MTKITIFCPATVPQKSGAGINAFNLALELAIRGNIVNILCFQRGGLPITEEINGIKIIRIPIFYQNIVSKILSYLIITPVFIVSLIRTDAGIVYGPIQGFLGILTLAKILKKKVLFRSTMFGVDDVASILEKRGRYLAPLIKRLLGTMGGYISQSPSMTQSLKFEYGEKIPFIETAQGVNTNKFAPLTHTQKDNIRQKIGLPKDVIIIISVGYVIKRKGLGDVFECLYKSRGIKYLYVVVGDYTLDSSHYLYGSQSEMLDIYNKGKELLGNNVLFTGGVNNTSDYLKAADFFILNSSKEGMPNVLLESMASGLPSIVKRLPGVDNYITFHNDNALVIDNMEGLDTAISDLLRDGELRSKLGKNARDFIVKDYSLASVASLIEKELL